MAGPRKLVEFRGVRRGEGVSQGARENGGMGRRLEGETDTGIQTKKMEEAIGDRDATREGRGGPHG